MKWTPLFSKIVESSLWSEPDHVRIVFVTMLALQDWDHVVRKTACGLALMSRKNESEVLDAIRILSSPDTRRIEHQSFEGRRIERVSDGWKILNGEYYQAIMRKENRLAYQAAWQQEYRKRKKDGKEGVKALIDRVAVAGASQAIADGMEEQRQELERTKPPSPSSDSPIQKVANGTNLDIADGVSISPSAETTDNK